MAQKNDSAIALAPDDAARDLSQYRPNVGVALFNAQGLVWLGHRVAHSEQDRSDPFPWQMPQGGVDPDEAYEAAALRELAEETGIGPTLVEPLGTIDRWLCYDFPPEVLSRKHKQKRNWMGQKQRWYAFRYLGGPEDFVLDGHDEVEFDGWRWAPISEAVSSIIDWKRPVYEVVAREFASFTRPMA